MNAEHRESAFSKSNHASPDVVAFACMTHGFAVAEEAIVGAIRWDGWYREGTVTKAVEASLGQPKYHFRLPWFAQLPSDGSVRINGDSQAIMEQELAYAAAARLNYWAIVDYWDEAPGMSITLNRYLAAKDNWHARSSRRYDVLLS